MRLHPRIGWEILCEFPELHAEAEIVYSHHERFDGKGYPRGLRAEQIPLGARIFSIADTFDAMTVDRPYRSALPMATARAEIQKHAGTQFDFSLADIFLGFLEPLLEQIRCQYPDDPPPAVSTGSENALNAGSLQDHSI
jgi:HD-GYP domain-containing protein (c-di-GMP phosphodiesterase class II)